MSANRPDLAFQRQLGQFNAGGARAFHHAGHQNNGCRSGTDDDGVHKYAQHTEHALVGRVFGVGSCGRIRCTAHAGLIGEQAALDALLHGLGDHIANPATGGTFQAKGTFDDQRKYRWQLTDIHNDHHQGNGQVAQSHNGYNHLGSFGNGANAAKDDQGAGDRQGNANG